MAGWCTIESDPGVYFLFIFIEEILIFIIAFVYKFFSTGVTLVLMILFCLFAGVFTELIELMGVKNVQVEEIYSLDESAFTELK